MAKELLWNEDMNCVYGWANDYKNEEEFRENVQSEFDLGTCKFNSIEKKLCIITEKGIPGDTVQPIELTDVELQWFYIAMVEPFEIDNDE